MREFHHIVDIDALLPEEAARMPLVHDLLFEALDQEPRHARPRRRP
jgi:hypothetical protein